ncbi:MAG TPA: ABC transporter ATP-binding protein, partial [Anaerolineae bacterium]
PSMGLAPVLVEAIFEIIQELNSKEKTTILLVEQNAAKALQISRRGYVIETGRIILEDSAPVLRQNEQVRKAYLGED